MRFSLLLIYASANRNIFHVAYHWDTITVWDINLDFSLTLRLAGIQYTVHIVMAPGQGNYGTDPAVFFGNSVNVVRFLIVLGFQLDHCKWEY